MEAIKFRVKEHSGTLVAYEWIEGGSWYYTLVGTGSMRSTGVKWGESLVREQFTTFLEEGTGAELYVGDKVSARDSKNKAPVYEGVIVFDAGCFSLKITKGNALGYNVGQTPPLYDFITLKLVA